MVMIPLNRVMLIIMIIIMMIVVIMNVIVIIITAIAIVITVRGYSGRRTGGGLARAPRAGTYERAPRPRLLQILIAIIAINSYF